MAALNFPDNPVGSQSYDAPNGVVYVFDGVKWIASTVSSTAEEITNSIQDRVAPMILNGTNNGVSVTYDDQTNKLNLTVAIDGGDASTTF